MRATSPVLTTCSSESTAANLASAKSSTHSFVRRGTGSSRPAGLHCIFITILTSTIPFEPSSSPPQQLPNVELRGLDVSSSLFFPHTQVLLACAASTPEAMDEDALAPPKRTNTADPGAHDLGTS